MTKTPGASAGRGPRVLLLAVGALVCLLWPVTAEACSCAWMGPFLKVAPRTALVVRATVVRHVEPRNGIPLAMDLDVVEVLRGSIGARRSMRVWGDNGAQCRPYVSGFAPGTEWLFAVSRLTPGLGPAGDFSISVCGEFWARVSLGEVVGRLESPQPPAVDDDARDRLSLAEVRRRLRAGSP